MEHLLKIVEHLSAHTDTLLEAACADRTDHELLEADGSVRVCATVDNVHHRNRKTASVAATDVFVEGEVEVIGSSLSDSKRHAKDSVCSKVALSLSSVKSEHSLVNSDLVESTHTLEGLGDRSVDISYSLLYALAHIA